ncbi:hypothetical protein XENTR_v10014788 [Xenopus tropicalis]|nr:hypothetical protein XENTR_v10014788 [Xenopus tropicalis]
MENGNQTSEEFFFRAFLSSTRAPAMLFNVFLFIYLLILVWNGLMMLLIKSDSHLHIPMYFLIFNLSFLDICYTSSVVPQTLASLLNPKHSITFSSCAAQMFCIAIFGIAQIVLITVMAYDRYVAIYRDRILHVIFLFGTPILNPLIYSVRNKAVKRGFTKLFGCKKGHKMT